MKKEDLLYKYRTRHTNILIPMSKYVSGDKYPEQDKLALGDTVRIRYRNTGKISIPEELMNPIDRIEEPVDGIHIDNFIVLRKDIEEPYKMVSISTDYKIILVQDSRTWMDVVAQYPVQMNEFCGITVHNKYPDSTIPELRGVTLRVDNGEPCYTVIFEFYEDDTFRIILGDECLSSLYEQYSTLDMNGVNPAFDPMDPNSYIDIDGWYPKFFDLYKGEIRDNIVDKCKQLHDYQLEYNEAIEEQDYDQAHSILETINTLKSEVIYEINHSNFGTEIEWIDLDGGLADLLKNLYTLKLSDEEIVLLRKELIGGYRIYGSD